MLLNFFLLDELKVIYKSLSNVRNILSNKIQKCH